MEQFVELLREVNVAQVFIILAGFWVFYNRLDKKIEKLDARINKQEMDMIEVKTVLRMIESNLSTHGHCLFNQAKSEQKAQ
jgi:hypothetical protein